MVSEFTYTLNNVFPAVSTDAAQKTFNNALSGSTGAGSMPNLFSPDAFKNFGIQTGTMPNFSGSNILTTLYASQQCNFNVFDMLAVAMKSVSQFNFSPSFSTTPGAAGTPQASLYKSDTSYFDYNAKKPEKLTESFYEKINEIAKEINCDPADLLGVMHCESGLQASAQNPSSTKATGLIQITEKTANALGTTVEDLKKMSAEDQLQYVKKYLVNAKSIAKIGKDEKVDGATLYSLVFLPAYAKKDVLTTKGESYYNANYRSLDVNKDGKIDKADLMAKVNQGRKALGYDAVNYLS